MFSGLGSHYYQMGKDLWESHPVFRTQMERGDAIVQSLLGRSVLDELYSNPVSAPFEDLAISHPALVMVENALFATLLSEGVEPDCVWGSSAGEFAAGIAARVWSLESALAASVEQAIQVVRLCPPGGMLAILGPPSLYESSHVIREHTSLAGVNFNSHFVVSGPKVNVGLVERFISDTGKSCQRLGVPFAFHSAGIDLAEGSFARFCKTLPEFKPPQVAYFSGMTARYLTEIPRSYFWDVVRQPMKFYEGVTRLEQDQSSVFVDCGPAGTLATFIKYGLNAHSQSKVFSTMTGYHQGTVNLEILKNSLRGKPLGGGRSDEKVAAGRIR